jgi:hypothetical protein
MKTIHITYKGQDMGESYIYLNKYNKWYLGDALYDLADKIGHESYGLFIDEIFSLLNKGQMQGDIGVLSFSTTDIEE